MFSLELCTSYEKENTNHFTLFWMAGINTIILYIRILSTMIF